MALDDKLKLTDEFPIHRSLGTYIPIGIMFVVLAVGYTKPQAIAVAYPIDVVLALLVSFVLQFAVVRRLNELALPNDFVARFRVHATLVQICDAVTVIMFAYNIPAGDPGLSTPGLGGALVRQGSERVTPRYRQAK